MSGHDIFDDAPAPTDVAKLLAEIDQNVANRLLAAFDREAEATLAKHGDVMWALAMLQAKVLAAAPMGPVQMWTAGRFSDMVRIAFPAALLALEKARREVLGERDHDA